MFRSLFLRSFPSLALLILIAVLSVAPEFDRAVEAQDTGGARGARSAAPAVRPHHPPPRGYTLIEQEGWAWAIPRGSDPPPEVWTTLIDERLAAMRVHLGRTGSIEPLVVRTPDPSSFRRVTVEFGGGTPEDWVAALAFPARGIVVLDAQRLAFQPYKRREIIAHELAHVVLGEAGPNIPRWYHEGVAQWLAGEQLEQEWTRLLARFASDDSMYRFAELKSFPPREPTGEFDLLRSGPPLRPPPQLTIRDAGPPPSPRPACGGGSIRRGVPDREWGAARRGRRRLARGARAGTLVVVVHRRRADLFPAGRFLRGDRIPRPTRAASPSARADGRIGRG